jgi:hypothetical protein
MYVISLEAYIFCLQIFSFAVTMPYSSVRTTTVYNDTNYSAPFVTSLVSLTVLSDFSITWKHYN